MELNREKQIEKWLLSHGFFIEKCERGRADDERKAD